MDLVYKDVSGRVFSLGFFERLRFLFVRCISLLFRGSCWRELCFWALGVYPFHDLFLNWGRYVVRPGCSDCFKCVGSI